MKKKIGFETDKARFAQAVISAFQSGVHTKVEGREYMYDVESRVERKGPMEMSSKSPLSKYLRLSPTRITNTTQSLLDVALTSPNSPVRHCGVRHCGVLNTTIGNHLPRLPVYVKLNLKSPKPSPYYITVRCYKNYSPSLFKADLASNRLHSLLSVFQVNEVNTKLHIFNKTIQSTLDSHAPIKTSKIRSCLCPFVSREIKDLMKTRDQLTPPIFTDSG